MEATAEKCEYKLKKIMLDIFKKQNVEIAERDFETVLILKQDKSGFKKGRDLEEEEEKYFSSSGLKKDNLPDLNKINYKEKIPLDSDNKKWIFFEKKEIQPTEECSTAPYQVFLGILMLNSRALRYEFLFECMLEEFVGKINDTAQALLEEEKFLNSFKTEWKLMLMRRYADWVIKEYDLPELERLNEISATRYERRECCARVFFRKDNAEIIEEFGSQGEEDREIREENKRMVRKLLEISQENGIDILAKRVKIVDGKSIYAVQALMSCEDDTNDEEQMYIKFKGYLHWGIFIGKKEVLTYYHGDYHLGYAKEGENYLEDIEKIQTEILLEEDKKQMLIDIVDVLKEQKHGTAVIFIDDDKEAETQVDHLCSMKRAIRVTSLLQYKKSEAGENGWNKETLLGISNIDGAIIMDLEGKCRAIGCIVDGKAVIPGKSNRGARLNSIENYVGSKKDGIYIGIIISEDGMIDIVHNRKEEYLKFQE